MKSHYKPPPIPPAGDKHRALWEVFTSNFHAASIAAFLGHTLCGLIIFAILALAALGLGKFVHWVQEQGGAAWLVMGLEWLEIGIFVVDCLCLGFFLWNAVRAAQREMIR